MDVDSIVDTYKDKYNEIKNTLERIFLARNYKIINNLQFYVNKAATMYLLVLTTNLSFLDINNLIMKGENSQMYRDFVQYRYKICCIVKFGMSANDTNKRYTDNVEEVDKRMMFRIELYKEGWNIEQIERYIYSRFFKQKELPIYDEEYFNIVYNNMLIVLNETRNNKFNKVGRPKLPDKLKEYLKLKYKDIIRENMRKKYSDLKEYEELKENLLTYEEFRIIKEKIKDEMLLKKISKLVIS
jgi:hypothetical protein